MNKLIGKMYSGSMFVAFLLTINNLYIPNKAFAMGSIKAVVAKSDKEKEEAKPATREQQKEIAQDFCSAVKGYWDNRDIDFHTKNESRNSDEINAVYENFFDGGVRTYWMKLELDGKFYQEALKNFLKKWDCKVLAGHLDNYLREKGTVHRCISFQKEQFSSTCIIYAVSEDNDENWYALDFVL